MPVSKVDVTRTRCASCGERTGVPDEDAFCYGCSKIMCQECTEEYDHIEDGAHGTCERRATPRGSNVLFSFISEKSADDFIRFMADEYELELELNAYLHIEVPSEEFGEEGALIKLHEEAGRFGANVLL